MNSNYAHLPPHIIVKIFKLLRINDFKNAVRVCIPWYNVSCCLTFGRQLKIHFIGDVDRSYKCIVRPFHRLELTQVNLSRWKYKDFLDKFSDSIRELHVTRCAITFNKLVKCLVYLENLETLLIEMRGETNLNITQKACSNLPNALSNLKVIGIICGADQCAGLNFVLSKCIKLEELSYFAHSLNFYDNSKIHVNMCSAMAQWPSVNLTSLKIESDANDVTSFFSSFRLINQVVVKKLNLRGMPDNYDRVEFDNFCKKLPDLEELELGLVNDTDLMSICKYLHKLRVLCIPEFSGRQLGMVGDLYNLEILNVMAYNKNQDQLYHLASSNIPNLIILKLKRIKISRNVLNLLCTSFKNLIKLELYLDTHDCGAIFKYQHKLNVLHLYFWDTCPELFADISTEYTCLNLTQLRYLNITKYVPGMTAELIPKMENLQNFEFLPYGQFT